MRSRYRALFSAEVVVQCLHHGYAGVLRLAARDLLQSAIGNTRVGGNAWQLPLMPLKVIEHVI